MLASRAMRNACATAALGIMLLDLAGASALQSTESPTDVLTEAESAENRRHRRRQSRPIDLGTSGGSTSDLSSSLSGTVCCGGTLGALLVKQGRYFILSNNHVLARFNQATVGEDVGQPGLLDNNCRVEGRNVIGTLSGFKKLRLNGKNKSDAAIAETDLDSTSGEILGIGMPGNKVMKPKTGTAVVKSGRTTGVTRGVVSAVNVSGTVEFEECRADAEIVEITFAKVFLIGGGAFSAGGDSGSVIYEDVDSCPRAMGLLFAGSNTFTAANPMKNVLKDVKKMTPRGKAGLFGCDPVATAGRRVRNKRLEAAERDAMRTQARTESALLAVPGVVAMGIGRAAANPEQVVFRVFVEEASTDIERAIPSSLDGFPVETVVSGPLRALSCELEDLRAAGGLEITRRP